MYPTYAEQFMKFAVGFANGFVLEKRTHFGGVAESRRTGGTTREGRPHHYKRRPLYVSAKRTHRFLTDFLVEVVMSTLVARETCKRNRWVRFRKRTHREGVLKGVEGKNEGEIGA